MTQINMQCKFFASVGYYKQKQHFRIRINQINLNTYDVHIQAEYRLKDRFKSIKLKTRPLNPYQQLQIHHNQSN